MSVHPGVGEPVASPGRTRVVVAMSGGVDSSVAAALLAEQGHDIVGVSMQLYDQREGQKHGNCCTLQDLNDARQVASALGLPHYILNLERRFHDTVVANFVDEYVSGRTPLPCAHCNSDLKFSTLVERAHGFGAGKVATGHYAQVSQGPDGRWRLHRGLDRSKDQSYFLFSLTQVQLAHALFPVGGLNKADVRAHARRLGLPVADKPDSQEICFVTGGDYAAFVAAQAQSAPQGGIIRDARGDALGTHDGIHRFTVGQRKGLGVSARAPLYVLTIDPETRDVTVGPKAALERTRLRARGVNWLAVDAPDAWMRVSAQIRHRHVAADARVRALANGEAEVEFDEPQIAIAPGQAVVFFNEDLVVGGGWIQ